MIHIFPENTLQGDFVVAEKPVFSWKTYFDESYQTKQEAYLNDSIGLRPFLIRLNNQIDFSLFKSTHAEGIVVGKHNNMFEYDYIRALQGVDFIGEGVIDRKIRRLKYLQDYLKKEHNIHLLLVFEPGKATVCRNDIPEEYHIAGTAATNYVQMRTQAQQYEVNHIDFEQYFQQIKDTVSYPLYPKYGIHWSNYGMSFVLDSLIKYIRKVYDYPLPDAQITSFDVTQKLRHPDYDIGNALNLLFTLPHEPMAYPDFSVNTDSLSRQPNVLVIGDSYYWNIYNTGIPDSIFDKHQFWYFCKKVYPDYYYNQQMVDMNHLDTEFKKWDIILIMMTHRFLYKFAWGIIDKLYSQYVPVSDYEMIVSKENEIKEFAQWFDSMIRKSLKQHQSLEKVIFEEAKYLVLQNHFEDYLLMFGITHYEKVIRDDPNWYKAIVEKAKENQRPVEDQLRLDAVYIFQMNYPEVYEKYQRIQTEMTRIRQQPELWHKNQLMAKKYMMSDTVMLRINALQKINN